MGYLQNLDLGLDFKHPQDLAVFIFRGLVRTVVRYIFIDINGTVHKVKVR